MSRKDFQSLLDSRLQGFGEDPAVSKQRKIMLPSCLSLSYMSFGGPGLEGGSPNIRHVLQPVASFRINGTTDEPQVLALETLAAWPVGSFGMSTQ